MLAIRPKAARRPPLQDSERCGGCQLYEDRTGETKIRVLESAGVDGGLPDPRQHALSSVRSTKLGNRAAVTTRQLTAIRIPPPAGRMSPLPLTPACVRQGCQAKRWREADKHKSGGHRSCGPTMTTKTNTFSSNAATMFLDNTSCDSHDYITGAKEVDVSCTPSPAPPGGAAAGASHHQGK